MLSKNDEIEFYSTIYLSALGKDRSFFHNKDSSSIYVFLTENYWGDSLALRLQLLAKLLYFDSLVAPAKMKRELVKKSYE
ncbi:MAG: hypothetical protein LBH19_13785, partial [Dysgonamonadaceae bacterium]|nr:hypothetical protein [Dysgonamonadaceae bacterium]